MDQFVDVIRETEEPLLTLDPPPLVPAPFDLLVPLYNFLEYSTRSANASSFSNHPRLDSYTILHGKNVICVQVYVLQRKKDEIKEAVKKIF